MIACGYSSALGSVFSLGRPASNPRRYASAVAEAPHEAVVWGDVCGLDYEDSDALEFFHFARSPPLECVKSADLLLQTMFVHRGFGLRVRSGRHMRFSPSERTGETRLPFLSELLNVVTRVVDKLSPP